MSVVLRIYVQVTVSKINPLWNILLNRNVKVNAQQEKGRKEQTKQKYSRETNVYVFIH